MAADVVIEHPNRETTAARGTRAAVLVVLLASAALMVAVSVGGAFFLGGGTPTAGAGSTPSFGHRRRLTIDRRRMSLMASGSASESAMEMPEITVSVSSWLVTSAGAVMAGALFTASIVVVVLGTLVIFTFDPCLDPASTLEVCR